MTIIPFRAAPFPRAAETPGAVVSRQPSPVAAGAVPGDAISDAAQVDADMTVTRLLSTVQDLSLTDTHYLAGEVETLMRARNQLDCVIRNVRVIA
jgi:hypothetical protein